MTRLSNNVNVVFEVGYGVPRDYREISTDFDSVQVKLNRDRLVTYTLRGPPPSRLRPLRREKPVLVKDFYLSLHWVVHDYEGLRPSYSRSPDFPFWTLRDGVIVDVIRSKPQPLSCRRNEVYH